MFRHQERLACSERTQTIPAANKKTIPAQSPAIKPLANSPARISKPKKVRILVRSLTNTYPRFYPLHAFLHMYELVGRLLHNLKDSPTVLPCFLWIRIPASSPAIY